MSTVASRVVDTLKSAGFPLQAIEIAERSGENQNTVRRTVRQLTTAGTIVVKDTLGNPYGSARYGMPIPEPTPQQRRSSRF